jgi:hypothetical protein
MSAISVEFANKILKLPSHLQKTVIALLKVGRADATEISNVTHRARAVESSYLNQLVLLGYLSSEQVGRKKKFFIAG